jgi:hypothetical protein
LYRATGAGSHQALAVTHLKTAATQARQYTARMRYTRPARIWTNRVGYVDFAEFEREAGHDVEIAQAAAPASGVRRPASGVRRPA